ncbi:MAG TPA: hypothetical protein VE987_13950, partial [Polyangiaceae bacterium]|nr:hypothetical protein [Polyangiaceae bacterium]
MKRQHISLIRAMLAASFGGALTLSQAPVAAAAQSDAPKLVASARGAKPDLATAKKRYNDGKNKFHVG